MILPSRDALVYHDAERDVYAHPYQKIIVRVLNSGNKAEMIYKNKVCLCLLDPQAEILPLSASAFST